jgi:membrane protease YdiL (CAAX protease family)
MPTLLDLLYVALIAVAWPLFDHFVLWPAFLRRSKADPARGRTWIWAVTIGQQWALVAAGAALWVSNDRSWRSVGLSVPDGWRLWTSLSLVLLLAAYYARTAAIVARSSRAKASVRKQFGELSAILPHSGAELGWFVCVSLTAGFCEEFLFRGYFIWAFAPWLGWWGAAALSLPIFASLHAYQGWKGALRTGGVGVLFTLAVAVFDSLWPAIALHALVDLGAGMIAWPALREEPAKGDVAEAEKQKEAQVASATESKGEKEQNIGPSSGSSNHE